jgi:predicted ATPase
LIKRYIISGTPGSGKTAIIRALELQNYLVVEEAATDVIALKQAKGGDAPWEQADFIDKVVALQKQRQLQANQRSHSVQIFDRSPICTHALAAFLEVQASTALLAELERIASTHIYEKKVIFLANLGHVKATEARRISYADACRFETQHLQSYAEFGYECLIIPAQPFAQRLKTVMEKIG